MSHDKLFLIVPPRPRRSPVRRTSSDLGNLLLWTIAIHGLLLAVSWCVFLNASVGVRVLIVALWVGYVALAATFIRSVVRSLR